MILTRNSYDYSVCQICGFFITVITSTLFGWNCTIRKNFHFSPMYLFIQLIVLIWIQKFLFISVWEFVTTIYLSCCSNCPQFGCWEPLRIASCLLFTCPHHLLSKSYFMVPYDVPGLFCILLASALDSTIQITLIPFITE